MNGFKKFILRGNVVDLAVGVVIGAAFNGVVQALVKDLLTPLISAAGKLPDFSGLTFDVNGTAFAYGDFLNQLISFLIVALAVYFFVVMPINKLFEAARREPPADPTTKKCSECESEISLMAKRCKFCAMPA